MQKYIMVKATEEEKAKAIVEHEQHIKTEVAREIFEEIEDVLNNIGYFDELDFKALKKKYTEDSDES